MKLIKSHIGKFLAARVSNNGLATLMSVDQIDPDVAFSEISPVFVEIFSNSQEIGLYVVFNGKRFNLSLCDNLQFELRTTNQRKYRIIIASDKIGIRTSYGYLSINRQGELSTRNWCREWELFELTEKPDCLNNRPLKLYFWKKQINGKYNVGDILSKYIVEKLSNRKVVFANPLSSNTLVAIGSLISDNVLKLEDGHFWGTGMHAHQISYYANNSFYAVRGPITRHYLCQAGYTCPEIFGDPALLLPMFYNPDNVRKKYKLGVVCHYKHIGKIKISDEVKVINILRDENSIESFVDEILECEQILSSSLHGIIISNAYGIPARWFIVDKLSLAGDPNKKFQDYFTSVQMPMQLPLVLNSESFVDKNFLDNWKSDVKLKINLESLIDAFPFY